MSHTPSRENRDDVNGRNYLFVYGTLRDNGMIEGTPSLSGVLTRVCEARVRGTLVDLGRYPGIVEGPGIVRGELCEVIDPDAFTTPRCVGEESLDQYENYDPADEASSMYVRRKVALLEPMGVTAWVYLYNRDVTGYPIVNHGDWIRYRDEIADAVEASS